MGAPVARQDTALDGREAAAAAAPFDRYQLLGIRVDAISIERLCAAAEAWIRDPGGRAHYAAFTGMHGITNAQTDPELAAALTAADANVPDGMPLVIMARAHGIGLRRRNYGPDFFDRFCAVTGGRYRHFFFGSTETVLARLTRTAVQRYGLTVAGTHSPPFRPPTAAETDRIIDTINSSGADVLWVGLGSPRQELWLYRHRERLKVPFCAAVGAAFDFHAGTKRQAPAWIRDAGFEWLYRLLSEPRRLWRRYLLDGGRFLWLILRHELPALLRARLKGRSHAD